MGVKRGGAIKPCPLASARSLEEPARSLGAADGPLLAFAQNPVVVVRCKRVMAGTAVDHVSLSDAPTVEVPADDVVVAVAPVEAVRAKAAEDGVVGVAVGVEGVCAV